MDSGLASLQNIAKPQNSRVPRACFSLGGFLPLQVWWKMWLRHSASLRGVWMMDSGLASLNELRSSTRLLFLWVVFYPSKSAVVA